MIETVGSFTLRGKGDGNENPAHRACRDAADEVYFAKDGRYNGQPGSSPFAACLVVGVYTGAPESASGAYLEDVAPNEVALIGVAALHLTQMPEYGERARQALIERLRVILSDLESAEVSKCL